MNIDERLEALTQSLELVAAMRRDDEQRSEREFKKLREQFAEHEQLFGQVALRLREVSDNVESLARETATGLRETSNGLREIRNTVDNLARETASRLREVTNTVAQVADSVDRLARVAGVHQDRLDGHEQRLKDLEGPRN